MYISKEDIGPRSFLRENSTHEHAWSSAPGDATRHASLWACRVGAPFREDSVTDHVSYGREPLSLPTLVAPAGVLWAQFECRVRDLAWGPGTPTLVIV